MQPRRGGVDVNWNIVGWCLVYGFLCALWQAGSSVYVLDVWPTAFTWLKIGSASIVAFVGGVFLFLRDPSKAWTITPGGKP